MMLLLCRFSILSIYKREEHLTGRSVFIYFLWLLIRYFIICFIAHLQLEASKRMLLETQQQNRKKGLKGIANTRFQNE